MTEKYCDYFDTIVDESTFEEALRCYHQWCKENKQKPEINEMAELDDLTEEELSHVLHHAEIQGFEI